MPVCDVCNDSHMMTLEDQGDVMCTRCPVPCQKCRVGGRGPYCENTPCGCNCHYYNKTLRAKAPLFVVNIDEMVDAIYSLALDMCGERQEHNRAFAFQKQLEIGQRFKDNVRTILQKNRLP